MAIFRLCILLLPMLVAVGCGNDGFNTDLSETGKELDLSVEGPGYFELLVPDGSILYTRSRSFRIDQNGSIVSPEGYLLSPSISVPTETTAIIVDEDGLVRARVANSESTIPLAQLLPSIFPSPDKLLNLGNGLFAESAQSGPVSRDVFGQKGKGIVRQGYLER